MSHERLFEDFVERAAALARAYVLGDPTQPETTLGPMVRTAAAEFVRAQVSEAVREGARALVEERAFALSRPGTPYVAPQILVDVDHSMRVMREESFGPVVGIMKVSSDEEAVAPHERQRLRPHRLDLDAGRRGRRWRSATSSTPAPCS